MKNNVAEDKVATSPARKLTFRILFTAIIICISILGFIQIISGLQAVISMAGVTVVFMVIRKRLKF